MDLSQEPRPVRGFRFAGVSAGLKQETGRPDLALIVADHNVAAAGVFTTNRVKAAPVQVAEQRLHGGKLRAIAVNSGCANCFTGLAGIKLAKESCAALAREIAARPELVVPCSTGVIGHLYDLEKYRTGLKTAVSELSSEGLDRFARAIMTTDTRPKTASVQIKAGGSEIAIAGAAKGAGMIAPKMATLLAFIVTDAAMPAAALKAALVKALPESFNSITIDGDMSTNDSLIMMASGVAENSKLSARDWNRFNAAVAEVAGSLARQLVYDGEGATKLVTIEVRGARAEAQASAVAQKIANSPLVKTAFFGCDPNVGRITAAAGAAGVPFDPSKLELRINDVPIAARGAIIVGALEAAAAAMREREFEVRLDLKMGKSRARVLTSDLSFAYVKINAEYTT